MKQTAEPPASARNNGLTHPPRTPRRETAIARKARKEILANCPRCHVCGSTSGPFELDHVQAIWLDGKDEVTNLAAICRAPCHKSKAGSEANTVRWIINRRHMGHGHGG